MRKRTSSILNWFSKKPAPTENADAQKTQAFLDELMTIAPVGERGHFRFTAVDGSTLGFAQLHCFEKLVQIHRLWAVHPGSGAGSFIVRVLCDLADRHQIQLKLKVLPIGRKPYPMSREQLRNWYQRFGFAGSKWMLIRKPLEITTPIKD